MHLLTFVLKQAGNPGYRITEDTILNELNLADYVTEQRVQNYDFTELVQLLKHHFGKSNVKTNSRTRTITVKKAGVVRYFIDLRARIKKAIDLAMDNPIEDFIHTRDEADWYAIKNMLEDPFATQFYMDGCGCSSMTVLSTRISLCVECM